MYIKVIPRTRYDWTRISLQTKYGNLSSFAVYFPYASQNFDVLSDGSYDWTFPAELQISNDYQIKITSTIMNNVNDLSDRNFEIFSGEAGTLAAKAGNKSLQTAFSAMRIIVTIGWAVYPLGYIFGYLAIKGIREYQDLK